MSHWGKMSFCTYYLPKMIYTETSGHYETPPTGYLLQNQHTCLPHAMDISFRGSTDVPLWKLPLAVGNCLTRCYAPSKGAAMASDWLTDGELRLELLSSSLGQCLKDISVPMLLVDSVASILHVNFTLSIPAFFTLF